MGAGSSAPPPGAKPGNPETETAFQSETLAKQGTRISPSAAGEPSGIPSSRFRRGISPPGYLASPEKRPGLGNSPAIGRAASSEAGIRGIFFWGVALRGEGCAGGRGGWEVGGEWWW